MSSAIKKKRSEAISYVALVKEKFRDKENMYDEFLHVLKEYSAQRIDTYGVIVKMKELFEGDQDLILGFNNFLPAGVEITPTPANEIEDEDDDGDDGTIVDTKVTIKEAICFVNKVKARFQGDGNHHDYKTFIDVLNSYKRNDISLAKAYEKIHDIFGDHPDLFEEFTQFVPTSFQHLIEQKRDAVYKYESSPDPEQWIIVDKTECDDNDKGAESLLSFFFGKMKLT